MREFSKQKGVIIMNNEKMLNETGKIVLEQLKKQSEH